MIGYTFMIRAVETQLIAFDMPEPQKSALLERAMRLYHEAALDENSRRMAGDKPDHFHLTYL